MSPEGQAQGSARPGRTGFEDHENKGRGPHFIRRLDPRLSRLCCVFFGFGDNFIHI
jgi:hypothetical protein